MLRDVVYHLGPGMIPQNLLVHLTLGDEFLGSGWMRHDTTANAIECESFGPSIGRNSERLEAVGAFDGFGTHPVVGDGFLSRVIDVSRGPHRRTLRAHEPDQCLGALGLLRHQPAHSVEPSPHQLARVADDRRRVA